MQDLRDKNRADMEKYIQEKANELAIFHKTTQEVQDLKKLVCEGLLDAVKGNFALADIKLQEISTKDDSEEVKQIIEKVKGGEGLESSIKENIRECNRTLKAREMEDLNTLLLWLIYGEWPFSIAELETVLSMQAQRSSLQPLAKEISDKFSAFLELGDESDQRRATVTLKYDSIADYFKNLSKEDSESETSAVDTLTKGEIRMVQHFVEKLCDDDIYTKLGFEDFFQRKLSKSDTGVAVDCENAQARLALICLRVLTTHTPDDDDEMKWYAQWHVSTHLKQTDLDSTDPRLKADLGPPLVKMFRDPKSIAKLNDNSWNQWSFFTDELKDVLRLFRSSALKSKINAVTPDNLDWVNDVLANPHPEVALLKDSAKEMARRWFSLEDEYTIMQSFQWLYGYVNLVSENQSCGL